MRARTPAAVAAVAAVAATLAPSAQAVEYRLVALPALGLDGSFERRTTLPLADQGLAQIVRPSGSASC